MVSGIRIVSAPIGEAPLWVREAWIGCELPLRDPREQTVPTVGVLSGPRSCIGWIVAKWARRIVRETGYVVDSAVAVKLLSARRLDAADWWHKHCHWAEHAGREFLFDTPACEPIDLLPANEG